MFIIKTESDRLAREDKHLALLQVEKQRNNIRVA
jgi:hypothetical protein